MNEPTPIDPNDELESQMKLASAFSKALRVEATDQGEKVYLPFSLFGGVSDPQEREELLQFYRSGFEETLPLMHERLSEPLMLDSERGLAEYNHGSQEVIAEALQHIRAIFEGTHRWAPLLSAEQGGLDQEAVLPRFSGCRIELVTRRETPEEQRKYCFIFFALLYDREDCGPDDVPVVLDTDPQVEKPD